MHACNAPNENGWYSADSCDFQGACEVDIWDVDAVDRYGPGDSYDVNTPKPFNVRVDYLKSDAGDFDGYKTTLTQGEQQIVFNGNCSDYASRMTDQMKDGMVFILSSWNPSEAGWLKKDRCQDKCSFPVATGFGNLKFHTVDAEKKSTAVG